MRLARWGRSPYETDADMAAETAALREIVEVSEGRHDAEIVVVHSKIPFGARELALAPSLKMLVTTTSGTDHIDGQQMADRNIVVARLPEARRDAVVDATIGMLVWGLRRVGPMQSAAKAGEWARSRLPEMAPVGIRGARIGVLGLGVIGCRVAEVLKAMGAEVVGNDPVGVPEGVEQASIEDIVASSAALTLHCDLNPSSAGLISGPMLHLARPGMVLVNTARGSLVDVGAAKDALEMGRLSALCLDVFPIEPWPEMSDVSSHPGLLFLPHAAGYHTGLAAGIREGLLEAVQAFRAGRLPRYPVQPSVP